MVTIPCIAFSLASDIVRVHNRAALSLPSSFTEADTAHFVMVTIPCIIGAYCIFIFLLTFLWFRGVLRF